MEAMDIVPSEATMADDEYESDERGRLTDGPALAAGVQNDPFCKDIVQSMDVDNMEDIFAQDFELMDPIKDEKATPTIPPFVSDEQNKTTKAIDDDNNSFSPVVNPIMSQSSEAADQSIEEQQMPGELRKNAKLTTTAHTLETHFEQLSTVEQQPLQQNEHNRQRQRQHQQQQHQHQHRKKQLIQENLFKRRISAIGAAGDVKFVKSAMAKSFVACMQKHHLFTQSHLTNYGLPVNKQPEQICCDIVHYIKNRLPNDQRIRVHRFILVLLIDGQRQNGKYWKFFQEVAYFCEPNKTKVQDTICAHFHIQHSGYAGLLWGRLKDNDCCDYATLGDAIKSVKQKPDGSNYFADPDYTATGKPKRLFKFGPGAVREAEAMLEAMNIG